MKNVISRCRKLIKAGRYKKAKKILTVYCKINNSAEVLALFSHASILLGDYEAADSQVKRALQRDKLCVTALSGKAFLSLNYGSRENALRTYFTILDIEPENKLAKENIERIKFLTNSVKHKEVSPRKFLIEKNLYINPKILFTSVATFLLVFVLYFSINGIYPIIRYRIFDKEHRELRERLKEVYLFDGFEKGELPASAQSKTYSPKEIVDMFEKAKLSIKTADVNSAVLIINEALRSDINEYLKERFRVLKSFITTPDYALLKESPDYLTIASDTDIYNGAYVKWTAEVSSIQNIKIGEEEKNKVRVLVYDQMKKKIVGISDVIVSKEIILTPKKAIEIYGKIEGYNEKEKVINIDAQIIKHLPKINN